VRVPTKRVKTTSRATGRTKPATKNPVAKKATAKTATPKPTPKRSAAAPKARAARRQPMTKVLSHRLLHLEDRLKGRIVGKDEAVERIARVIRVRLTQLDLRPERPRGRFLILGPHGAGKSELATALAEALYGSEVALTTIDLDEFEDEERLGRLGSTIVNTPEPTLFEGSLTTPVRQRPDGVILLRNLDRAHPAIHRVLMQILERGVYEDMVGPVSFARSIVFVTATIRRDELPTTGIGFSRASRLDADLLRERLERVVLPDLLDAFDEIVELQQLRPMDVRRIARYKVTQVLQRTEHRRRSIEIADEVFQKLIPDDVCEKQGAALLNRTLEDGLFNPLARYLLAHRGPQTLKIDLDPGGQVQIHPVRPLAARPRKS